MKKLLVIFALILNFAIAEEPKPFDLELGKATFVEFKERFKNYKISVEPYVLNYQNYIISKQNLNLSDAVSAEFIFDGENILQLVNISFPKHNFDAVREILDDKYKLKDKQDEFFNKTSVYLEGNTEIILEKEHMGDYTELTYRTPQIVNDLKQLLNDQNDRKSSSLKKGL